MVKSLSILINDSYIYSFLISEPIENNPQKIEIYVGLCCDPPPLA